MRTIAKLLIPRPARHALRLCFDEGYRDRLAWDRDRQMGQLVHDRTGGVVVGGPFQGLQYVDVAIGSTLAPKLLGTYEVELAPIVEQIIARDYQTIINIGAGEGYYAVGLARRMPDARIICFEAVKRSQDQLRRMAELNGGDISDRIEIHGLCTADSLGEVLVAERDALIVCDIEGAELEVLRPDIVPSLRAADVLLETHDGYRPGTTRTIRRRFQNSHAINTVWSRRRTAADWPTSVDVEPRLQRACMDEGRGRMSWLWMSHAHITRPARYNALVPAHA